MSRLKALIAYDGTSFFGWQIQKDYPTIQSTIERALFEICRKEVRVTGAGRTDSGVHAFEQVAHFDWDHPLPLSRLILAMNGLLPPAIRILSMQESDPEFHARFDAKSKTYLYRIQRNRCSSPFNYLYSHLYSFSLDLDLIQKCARVIEGEHDFAAFQAAGTDISSTRRVIFSVESFHGSGMLQQVSLPLIDSPQDEILYVRIRATGFLRKMVRFLVGTMLEIGSGRRPIEDLERALETCERRYVGIPVPARGLFLEKVYYGP